MVLSQEVESYRFWDVVTQWAREQLQHETVVARSLAKAVVRDGLRLQSVDAAWSSPGTFELRGAPLVGYVARDGDLPVFLRAKALRHLMAIVQSAAAPDPQLLFDEYITKQDFAAWAERVEVQLPSFWFAIDANLAS